MFLLTVDTSMLGGSSNLGMAQHGSTFNTFQNYAKNKCLVLIKS